MESVSFVGIDIKVVAWDERSRRAVAEDWLEVPPAVDANNVEDYVFGRFGDPVDVAVGRSDDFGELVMGWVFPPDLLAQLDLPSDGLDMMVVPFVRFPDGSRRELFDYTAELNSEFASLVASIDPDAVTSDEPAGARLVAPAPIETRDRLEHERAELYGADPEHVELQLGGWLRRMLGDGWTYLIVELTGTGRYVQYLVHDGSWLRGEAVGDRYLDDEHRLDADQHQRLVDLGWNAPGDAPDDCGNYWVEWGEEPVDHRDELGATAVPERDIDEAARFGAAALCQVLGLRPGDDVAVTTGPASHVDD